MKTVIDLFAGAGGESCGIHRAFEAQGEKIRLFAVNHWQTACETHAANFPQDECICQDIQTVIPTDLVKPNEEVELMWASPECFASGTLVLTDKGYMPIEDISVGDSVLSHTGKWRKVTHVMQAIKPTVVISGYGHYGIRTTENHPFYISERTKIQYHRSFEYSFSSPDFAPVSYIKGKLGKKNTNIYWCKISSIEPLPIPQIKTIGERRFDIDERMMWLAGRYVADGYVRLTEDRADITISCGHSKYKETKNRLCLWPRKGARSGSNEIQWAEHKGRTVVNFIANSRGIAEWLVSNFGQLAEGKSIPSWLYGTDKKFREAFIEGYMSGDGHVANGISEFSTVSRRLASGMLTLLATLGINAQFYKPKARPKMRIEGREVLCRQQYTVKWRNCVDPQHNQTPSIDKLHLWGAIKNITSTEGKEAVYNLSVEEDESYVVEGVCVHNCTHFSTARGGKPMDNQSRCTPFDIIRWVTMLRIKRLIIENVPEFLTWGPLDNNCRPVAKEKGSFFMMFINSLRGCGYDVDWRICCAADYGAPTTRRRLFIQAVRKGCGKTLIWPEAEYSSSVDNDNLFAQETKPWIPASSIIDWSIPCQSIDERKKPLSPNTMKRIMNGIRKYWGEYAEPFLVRYNGGDNRYHSLREPVPTLDCSNRYGIVQPIIAELYGKSECRSIDKPLSTVSCSGAHHALVQPMLIPQQSCGAVKPAGENPVPTIATAGAIGLIEPLSTICTKQEHCLIEPLIMEYYGNGKCDPVSKPLGTVTCKDRFALLSPDNCRIGFRMLQPHELAAAQSFPSWYKFKGTKTEVVKQIGNAVCPKMAEALVRQEEKG